MNNRIILRPFKIDDWEDIYEYLSDAQVVQYEPYNEQSLESCKELAKLRSDNEQFLAIEEIETKKVIGNLFLEVHGLQKYNTYMIGYVLNAKYWSQGFASEAVNILLKDLFKNKNAHRVIARCHVNNTNSWKLLERNNFRREGLFKSVAYFSSDNQGHPNWHDAYQYAILKKEWEVLGKTKNY